MPRRCCWNDSLYFSARKGHHDPDQWHTDPGARGNLHAPANIVCHHPFAAAWACREWRAACNPGTNKPLGRHSSQPINYGLVVAVQEQYSGRVSH